MEGWSRSSFLSRVRSSFITKALRLRAYRWKVEPDIRLMVNLLFIEDDDALSKPGVVRSLYDPTAGTGGMLSVNTTGLYETLRDKAAS